MRTLDYANGVLTMIDQTVLPQQEVWLAIDTVEEVVAAIKRLSVRGAPAIGVAGAYGVVMAARLYLAAPGEPGSEYGTFDQDAFDTSVAALRAARPTAVNLAYAVDRIEPIARTHGVVAARAEADKLRDEELAASIAMGDNGADLVTDLTNVASIRAMTICNTGGLASVERGTALAVVQTLHERGSLGEALPLETRPLLQGGRLTTWELQRMGAPFRLIVDSAGPFLLSRGAADVVLIGADRIAANGDTANKIGSFSLALAAAHAGVPFVVVAPETTIDMATASGDDIAIEDRGPTEVAGVRDWRWAPEGIDALNPAFDITPAHLITAIVTDRRVIRVGEGESL